ncbi:unnamed protein product [Microthlaspi erraticum]|uniref:TF-B3 domain-containing protein n=1 Tax=Microthlaspi erraticum TaxID=1685480 RepID=A0A6D2JJF3_9BRAS|nr:unnamed protein product [Microthlaspi erraticum]
MVRELPQEIDLNALPCTITKVLTKSDVNGLSRLLLETSAVETHILPNLSEDDQNKIQDGVGVDVEVFDEDTRTEHKLTLKRMVYTTRSYVLNGVWIKQFVQRRELKRGNRIGFFWNGFSSRLHFCVLP